MTCPLFVELCAGTAAVSLRLHRDGARPPVSRMGAKTGYADTILRVLGLVPGQRAAAYLWCEPDPGVRLLLEAYRDGALAKAAAAIIRSWAGEDPRALWERLRAEGPPRCPDGDVEAGEVARWTWLVLRSVAFKGPQAGYMPGDDEDGSGRWVNTQDGAADKWGATPTLPAAIAPDARQVDPREVARWLYVIKASQNSTGHAYGPHCGGRNPRTGEASPFRLSVNRISIEEAPTLPAAIAPDARQVDPREVARQLVTGHWAYRRGEPASGFAESLAGAKIGPVADRLAACRPLPALIHPDARAVDPGPALPPGTVCYMDPPYVGTTGYASDLPRAEVVALALRWAAAGAVVCVSEAEAIPELVAEGWHAVRIDGERVGQRRTFSRQQAEWLTLSRAPAWVPSVQGALFGGAR